MLRVTTHPVRSERTPRTMKPHRLAVYGLTAGLLGGGAAGLLMTGTTLASAQVSDITGTVTDPAAPTDSTAADSTAADSGESTTTTAPAAADPNTATTVPAAPAPAADAARTGWARATLDKLVADGTITQAQADKVLAALDAARPAHGPGKGGRGHGSGKLDAAASALGMTVDELRTALEGGKSLAAVAQENGIDVAKVVDTLVAELRTHLGDHVASGKNTQAEVDQMLADARTRIEAFVNGTAPAGGPGKGGRHGHRGGAPANGTAPSSSSSGSGATVS